MIAAHRRIRVVVPLLAALLALAACGGSSSKSSASSSSSSSTGSGSSSSSPGSSSSASSSDGGSDGFGSAPEDVIDATYQQGTAHFEISGSKHATQDFTQAGGVTTSHAVALTFTDAAGSAAFTLALSSGEPGGINLSMGGIVTAAAFGQGCEIKVTQNTKAEFAGEIRCRDIDSLSGATDAGKVNVDGTFSAKPA